MNHRIKVFFASAASIMASAAMADDRPLALVEHVTGAPEAGLVAFDYVYENDKIDLRPGGELSLAYFDRCEVETFSGGVLKLKTDKVKISKGGVSTTKVRPCQTAALMLSEEAREAGVAVKRVTPFPEEEWREISIATAKPTFVWPAQDDQNAPALVTLHLLEAEPVTLVWQGSANANHLAYPDDAPALMPGLPYKVTVSYDGEALTSIVFSIDPGLELPEGPLTTAVPLGL